MNKREAVELLHNEGWTRADAQRALTIIDFRINPNVDELTILRTASQFAGAELLNRQRLQAAQKGLVTRRNREIREYIAQIEQLTLKIGQNSNENAAELAEINRLKEEISRLIQDNDDLTQNNNELTQANDLLMQDNRNLRNIVDEIRFKLTVEIRNLLQINSILELRKRLVTLLKSTLG